MIVRDPNNVYFVLAALAGLLWAWVYFFGWRSILRRERDLNDLFPPRKDRD